MDAKMDMSLLIPTVLAVLFLGGFTGLILYGIWQVIIKRNINGGGSQLTAESLMHQFAGKDTKKAMEHVHHMAEEWRDEAYDEE